MNSLENWFCGSGYWRRITQTKLLPWMLARTGLGDRVLEIGAGPGAATEYLSQRAKSVTSLEYSHKFCVALHSDAPATKVVQGDASQLPFEDATFSGVIAVLVLHHLRSKEEQDRAFQEIHRVLKPRGVFVAGEIEENWLTRVAHFRSTFVPVAPESIAERLEMAGLSSVRVTKRSGGFLIEAVRRD
jgi:ubiquinone/menaquinone biosynthesis C-methylase UbiE